MKEYNVNKSIVFISNFNAVVFFIKMHYKLLSLMRFFGNWHLYISE